MYAEYVTSVMSASETCFCENPASIRGQFQGADLRLLQLASRTHGRQLKSALYAVEATAAHLWRPLAALMQWEQISERACTRDH